MHERPRADDVGLGRERQASPRGDVPVLVDVHEVPVRQALAEQRPEAFRGLELGRVGRLEDQVDPFRNDDLGSGVPASAVDDEHDPAVWSGGDFVGERPERRRGSRTRNGRCDEPFRPAGSRVYEAPHVVPLVSAAGAGEGVLDGIDTTKWAMLSVGVWPEEVEEQQVEEAVADAVDAATAKRRGQGYSADPAFRSAVELHAMELAKAYLKALTGTEPKNTSANHPYDFECPNAPHHRYVEVKGTTGDGAEVFLTAGEVEHARSHPGLCALVVVHGIQVERSPDGTFMATGGTLLDICPWSPDVGTLRSIAYRYLLPG